MVTGSVGVFLAVVAGWFVSDRRHATMVVVVPFLAVMAIQTWGIAAGHAVSPPSTVTGFPGSVPYYVVQAIILALALGSALQLGALRFRGAGARRRPAAAGSRTTVAAVVNGVLCVLVVCVFTFERPLFDPGSTAHHTSSGSPPVLGVAGIALSVLVCAGLGCLTLWRRRARPTRSPTAA